MTAVRDDIPELSETYSVSLLDPDTIGNLSDVNHSATVTIRPNQNPHGLLEIYTTERYRVHNLEHSLSLQYLCLHNTYSASSELFIEEDVGYVELEIRRSDGTFGAISVDLNTISGSAVSPPGRR